MSRPPRTTKTAGTAASGQAKATGDADAPGGASAAEPGIGRVIKKYPNRRLYDTQTSSYITLAEVKQMVLECERFAVLDAKTGEDISRSILLQIILEEETGGVPMFSTQVLAQIIRFYGHTMQGMMGNHLERNVQAFIDLQAKLTENPVLGMPNPMQAYLNTYAEQSKNLFAQMQEQMTRQTQAFMGNLGAAGKKSDD
jgi:polyhydroxyalkanoate synthesis repressor PhaR